MPKRSFFALSTILVLSPQAPALAQEALDLDALFNTARVGVATKRVQSVLDAPAVVEVVTGEEMRRRGYASVAEALRALPGFYMIHDRWLPSLGVRGISSGQRSWSRIVKVMIDGQPVPYRPDGSNWLGPELIPLDLVQRLEIIRGPASALYGADAFLGVINVVTVTGEELAGGVATAGAGGRDGRPQGQAGLAWGSASEHVETLIGGAFGLNDQDGLRIGPASPLGGTFGQTVSANDVRVPASGFGRLGLRGWGIDGAIDGAYQRLSAGGEFQDWRPLTHQTVVSAENRFIRARARRAFEAITGTASVAYARANPTAAERLSLGREDYHVQRELSADAIDMAADASWAPDDRRAVTVGADFSRQQHQLPTTFNVFTPASGRAGERLQAGEAGGAATLDNWGGYLQGTFYPLERLGVTANLRDDLHSLYGNQLSGRLGLVWRLADDMAIKALAGSSFKAPSVPQLYGTPLIFGDILGNRELKPEHATTLEGAVVYVPGGGVTATGSVYWTHVADKVSFFTRNGNPFAVNLGQLDSAGLEGSLTWRWRYLNGLLNASLQKTVPTLPTGFADPDGLPEPYPAWMLNAGLGGPLGTWPIDFWLEGRYVGAVPASQANYAANGHEAYSIAPALVTDFTLTNAHLFPLGGRPTRLVFKVANLLDAPYAQPGYGGVDYPGLGRTLSVRLSQAF